MIVYPKDDCPYCRVSRNHVVVSRNVTRHNHADPDCVIGYFTSPAPGFEPVFHSKWGSRCEAAFLSEVVLEEGDPVEEDSISGFEVDE